MAREYKINAVSPKTKEWDSKYGTMITYYVKVDGETEPVQVNKKSDSSAPKVGDELYGEITSTEYGNKFKAEKKPFGGSSNFSKRVSDESMYRTSALKNATEFAYHKGLEYEKIPAIADTFYSWLKGNGDKGNEQPSLKEQWNNTQAKKQVEGLDEVYEPTEEDLKHIPF